MCVDGHLLSNSTSPLFGRPCSVRVASWAVSGEQCVIKGLAAHGFCVGCTDWLVVVQYCRSVPYDPRRLSKPPRSLMVRSAQCMSHGITMSLRCRSRSPVLPRPARARSSRSVTRAVVSAFAPMQGRLVPIPSHPVHGRRKEALPKPGRCGTQSLTHSSQWYVAVERVGPDTCRRERCDAAVCQSAARVSWHPR